MAATCGGAGDDDANLDLIVLRRYAVSDLRVASASVVWSRCASVAAMLASVWSRMSWISSMVGVEASWARLLQAAASGGAMMMMLSRRKREGYCSQKETKVVCVHTDE